VKLEGEPEGDQAATRFCSFNFSMYQRVKPEGENQRVKPEGETRG
jgi:hypothetical protein